MSADKEFQPSAAEPSDVVRDVVAEMVETLRGQAAAHQQAWRQNQNDVELCLKFQRLCAELLRSSSAQ